jgi:tetratricopeptide (TPR) repeat protein
MDVAPFIEAKAKELRGRLLTGAMCLVLVGPVGAGKSSVLRAFEDGVRDQARVVHVGLPRGDDAAMVALATTAAQIDDPGLQEQVKDPKVPWAAKLEQVRRRLERMSRDAIVILDEPVLDVAAAPHEELFVERAVDMTNALLQLRGPKRVIAAEKAVSGLGDVEIVRLPGLSWAEGLAALPEEIAGALRDVEAPQQRVTPSTFRLLGALVAADVDLRRLHVRPERLLAEMSRVVSGDDLLRRILTRLSVIRWPFPRSALALAGYPDLDARGKRMLDVLLAGDERGLLMVPEAMRREIESLRDKGDPFWFGDEPADAHMYAAEVHRQEFERAVEVGDVQAAIRNELEQIHQLTSAGDRTLLARPLWFAEQYDALGKVLSQRAHRASREEKEPLRRDAIRAYELAVEHDANDAYAHHYIAYNLDILATDPGRTEQEYKAALALDPDHAWFHERFMGFLIARGRMIEAKAAWERALEVLPEQPADRTYEELHGQVARLALNAGELAFADEVLEGVPPSVRIDAKWWRALDRLRRIYREARDERMVFPPSVAIDRRWEGPHLVPDPKSPRIAGWMPGVVVATDRELHLRVARRDPMSGEELISYLHLPRKKLREMLPTGGDRIMPPVGTFVEIISYQNGTSLLLAYGSEWSVFQDQDLPRLFPPPDRYIRRAAAAS